jgi:zona occludens toxin
MLTLITGTPGAGKTLYAVGKLASTVPGSTIEMNGQAVPRRLLSNIKGLIVEHERIEASDLEGWHKWAQPGDVILFDEVQEVWRSRAMGSKVPEPIQALETHRHMGVDFVLVTQHPMLLDSNIRRLVNRHLHVRRIGGKMAMVYEWDHCANPQATKAAMQTSVFWHRRRDYALYKSAQAHTKPVNAVPRIMWLGIAALAGLAYVGPMAYGRLKDGLAGSTFSAGAAAPGRAASAPVAAASGPSRVVEAAAFAPSGASSSAGQSAARVFAGCASTRKGCKCFDAGGLPAPVVPELCIIPETTADLDAIYGPGVQLRGVGPVRIEAEPLVSSAPGDVSMIASTKAGR